MVAPPAKEEREAEDKFVKALSNAAEKMGATLLTGKEADTFVSDMMKKHEEEKKSQPPIQRYHYKSKYQFPDDIDLFGSDDPHFKEGFRNAAHLSVSRGLEFMETENPKDFTLYGLQGIAGYSFGNNNTRALENHISKCIKEELGERWGHSGMTMSLAVQTILQAAELGWDEYIKQVCEVQRKGGRQENE